MMLAKIYEEFLGKRLMVRRGKVREEIKGEYIKTNGAVPTPEHIVKLVCERTFAGEELNSLNKLLACRILDPCCGSGGFLLASYDFLESQFLKLLQEDDELRDECRDYYFVDDEGNWLLTIPGRRLLIVKCLYGVDVDEAAVEVTKMSLALKMLDGNCVTIWDVLGANGKRILQDIAANVKFGNTLVRQSDVPIGKRATSLRAFDPETAFPAVFGCDSPGFTFVVCNPPYVETKFFKEAQPDLHAYLSRQYASYEGKADLAVMFIERCMGLLSQGGKAGFIVQRRWFKTDYGRGIRKIINGDEMLESLIEFVATDIFPRRITYVAIMTLTKRRNGKVRYRMVEGCGADVRSLCERGAITLAHDGEDCRLVAHPQGDSPWNFSSSRAMGVYDRLLDKFGRFDACEGLSIKDGTPCL